MKEKLYFASPVKLNQSLGDLKDIVMSSALILDLVCTLVPKVYNIHTLRKQWS